jgi:hypothetical protein
MTQRVLHAAQILWPAFLVAGVLEMVVFSWVDPTQLRIGQWQPDAQTTYSLAFLRVSDSPAHARRVRRHARRQQVHNHA